MLKVNTIKLSSGLQLILVPMPAFASLTSLLLVNTGSRFEDPSEHGLAHLLEHMVFRGTKKYPVSHDLSIAFDSIGGSSNAFTSKEYTGYYVTAASTHLELSLQMLRELIFFPLMRPEDLEQEKAIVIEEIKMHLDSPEDFIADEFEQMIYKGTGLEHPISGSIELVQQQSVKSMRTFLQKWYGLENITLVVAGDAKVVEKKETITKIGKIFDEKLLLEGELGKRANHHQSRREQYFQSSPFSSKKKIKKKKPTEQTHAVLGWPALKRDDPQRYVLTVLATILGGNRSSRLFQVVREKANLAYYVFADVDQYHDAGLLGASAGLNSAKAKLGIDLIQAEFEQLASGKKPPTRTELKHAKDYLTGRILLGLESSRAVAQHYGLSWLLLGRIEDPSEVIEGIKKVKLEEIQLLAEKIIKPGEMRLAMVGE